MKGENSQDREIFMLCKSLKLFLNYKCEQRLQKFENQRVLKSKNFKNLRILKI